MNKIFSSEIYPCIKGYIYNALILKIGAFSTFLPLLIQQCKDVIDSMAAL